MLSLDEWESVAGGDGRSGKASFEVGGGQVSLLLDKEVEPRSRKCQNE